MKTKTLIVIFLFAIIFVMAKTTTPSGQKRNRKVKNDTIALKDSIKKDITPTLPAIDTTKMDSLQLAIYHHNQAIDDSIRLDSINRAKKNGIDAPVSYKGNDSLVYDAKAKRAYIYGEANVKYENMDLTSDRIALSMDSSLVHAVGTPDSLEKGGIRNKPVFKMGDTEYQSDTMAFNFKTKKGFINNVTTHQ